MEVQGDHPFTPADLLLAPLVAHGRRHGVLALVGALDEPSRALAPTIAAQVTQALVLSQALEDRARSERIARQLLDATDQGICGQDAEGRCTLINRA